MSTRIRFMPPRGTATDHSSFTGDLGELSVDTTSWQLRVHDGTTVGGHVQGGISNLIGCSDVNISSPSTGQYLRYNASTSKWENQTIAVADVTGAAPLASPTFTGTLTAGGVKLLPNASLPTGTGGHLYFSSDYSSPISGRLFVGDGSGWSFKMAKRLSSTTTDLFTFADSGAFTATGTITGSSFSGSGASLTGITSGQVSGLATSATTDTTSASNISSGTLAAARLSTVNDANGSAQPIGTRNIPLHANPGSTYTLTAADVGRCVIVTSGTMNVTVPSGVFSAGDVITICNDAATSGTGVTITQGSGVSMYWQSSGSGSATSSGNRTLAGTGICTLFWTNNGTQCLIQGGGLA